MSEPNKHYSLPSKKSVDEAIKLIENFRDLCRHQMDVGLWATADFPSKHHINRLLQLGYRNRADLAREYGEGLARHIYEITPTCKAYVAFMRDANEQKVESK